MGRFLCMFGKYNILTISSLSQHQHPYYKHQHQSNHCNSFDHRKKEKNNAHDKVWNHQKSPPYCLFKMILLIYRKTFFLEKKDKSYNRIYHCNSLSFNSTGNIGFSLFGTKVCIIKWYISRSHIYKKSYIINIIQTNKRAQIACSSSFEDSSSPTTLHFATY